MSKGFSPLPCPKCSEPDGILLDLSDLDTISCNQCNTDFALSEVRDLVGKWMNVIYWIDGAGKYTMSYEAKGE